MPEFELHHHRPPIIVIGCDDVGSAIASVLHRGGAAVVLVDAVDPPWARRGRAYTDAWYVGGATLDGIDACFCGSVKSIPAILARGDMIAATTWSWEGVAASLHPVAVIDTRVGRATGAVAHRPAELQRVLAIGVETARVGAWRADVVIAKGPSSATRAWPAGSGESRSAYAAVARIEAPRGGRFRTRHQIAERVECGDVIGVLGMAPVVATTAGVLTALASRGARIEPGHTLAEIDPGGAAHCFGIAPQLRAIAHRVGAAIRNATKGPSPELPSRARAPSAIPA